VKNIKYPSWGGRCVASREPLAFAVEASEAGHL